ncbi:MAG: hypothetical protein QOK37_2993 [Thermoanaerobaculia bacterium]|jgi:subtilisin family serine protease|nr:hypothetical protein [Thermoanaerobaculia bacterium]
MRRFAVVVAVYAFAVSGWAQVVPDQSMRIEMSDGTVTTLAPQFEPAGGVIVEFAAPPAVLNAGKSAIDYRATFSRFRNDLATIVNAGRAGKSALATPEIRREYFVVFNGVALEGASAGVIAQIRALPYVKRVEADRAVHACANSANITIIGADKVWSTLGSRGKGVTVAIIDTGIDYMHPALGGGFGPGFKVIGGWDFVNNDADPFDDAGHGTHVAGIVAGDSATITGVAPDVNLVAYKVLGANGGGTDSNVIAAIERAADPNSDGNTSDHVDVANLSLGGGGNPDDPPSVAIDNATAAGVTFAIAAGNSGNSFHTIGSPGTARSAITVGASDLSDAITSFSSRGPNTKNLFIKPDVVAPGSGIVSSFPGNRYVPLSGTSMAAPHVAGAAALLKSLHHDWTPLQIKQALMNNAKLLAEEIMAEGAGRIDVFAAANGSLVVDPPSLSLALAPTDNNWTATRTLHLTNRGTKSLSYATKANVTFGEVVTPSPATVTIPAGGSADITVNFAIDNTQVRTSTSSFTGGGQIVLTNTTTPSDVRNIQFAFTKAARVTTHFDRAFPAAVWISADHNTLAANAFIDENTSESLMLPGKWDMLIWTQEGNSSVGTTAADFIAREGVTLAGDTTLSLTAADIPYKIKLNGRRETGQPLSGGAGYLTDGRILLGGTSGITALSFPWTTLSSVNVSDLSSQKSLLFYEALLDSTNNNYYMIQHPPLAGVSADVTLSTGGSSLRGGLVQIAVPPASIADRRLIAFASTTSGTSGLPNVTGIVDAPVVNAHVFVSPDVHPSYTYGFVFSAITDGVTQYTTPLLRVRDDKLVSLGAAGLLPWTYSGSTYEFGLGPRFPTTLFTPSGVPGLTKKATLTTEMIGPLGEIRIADRTNTVISLTNTGGTPVSSEGNFSTFDLTAAGAYKIDVTNRGTLYPGVSKTTGVSMMLDSSRTDYIPPSLTTMMLLDGSGVLAPRLAPHGTGSLLFSAADYSVPAGGSRIYQPIRGDATAVSYRYSGETAWRALTATQVTEDSTSGAGILYRVDLGSVANIDRALVDLKFDLADAAGNTTTVTMTPAFSVGPEVAQRHRAER